MPDHANKRYHIEILEGVSEDEYALAEQSGTVKNSRLVPPGGSTSTPIKVLHQNMRMWEKDDFSPQIDDVFQERLYCIRWVETYYDENGKPQILSIMKSELDGLKPLRYLLLTWERPCLTLRIAETSSRTPD